MLKYLVIILDIFFVNMSETIRYNDANLFIDNTCDTLVKYLKENINKKSKEKYNYILVKSTRSYDAFNVPNQEYPLLMVFRSSELFEVQKSRKTVNLVVRYCLLLPEMEKIMPLCSWVVNEIHNAVNNFYTVNNSIKIIPNNSQVEYKVSDTQSSSFIYNFVNYYFSIRE